MEKFRLTDLGCGQIEICWFKQKVAAEIRRLINNQIEIIVDAVDLENPASYQKMPNQPGFTFRGFAVEEYNPQGQELDAILMRYPAPSRIVNYRTGERITDKNPLDTALELVKNNLKPGGQFFFETDLQDHIVANLGKGHEIIIDALTKAGLRETTEEFNSTVGEFPYMRSYGRVWQK